MNTKPENRFNLIDEAWIPVTGEGLVSLHRIFSDDTLRAIGGNPVQKISLFKLLLAIAQAAYTPEDNEEWAALGAKGMAERALNYLEEKKKLFWLYGERPFLQMPEICRAMEMEIGAAFPNVATGNTTVLFESQVPHSMTDADKALLIVTLLCFALGGKKTDNSVVLSAGYSGKSNEKGKPSTGKPGPSLGFLGYLHSFLSGADIIETIWLNVINKSQLQAIKVFSSGLGIAPWESMPVGEDCDLARVLKNSYMGRLIPLSRFVLLTNDGFHYSEGLAYPTYKDGGYDLSVAVDFSGKPKALWVNPERRPWRVLTSLLSFLSVDKGKDFECAQLKIGVIRAIKTVSEFGIWSGGLKVSSNAGEQYASGMDDFIESEIKLDSKSVGDIWFTQLKAEMGILEDLAAIVYTTTIKYYKIQKAEGKDQAQHASSLFWQLCERKFQTLVDACNDPTGNAVKPLRKIFAGFVHKAYNTYCPKETARQLDAWAANRPNLGKFLTKE